MICSNWLKVTQKEGTRIFNEKRGRIHEVWGYI